MRRWLNQVATYWGSPLPNGVGGYTYAGPTIIKCRWEDKIEEITSPQGGPITSRATVYLDQEVAIDGYLYLGESEASDPTEVDGAYKIIATAVTPDLWGLKREIRAFL